MLSSVLPCTNKAPENQAGVVLQSKLFTGIIFHFFFCLLAIAIVDTIAAIMKHILLLYLVYYCRTTLSMGMTTLYAILLVAGAFAGFFDLSTWADMGSETVANSSHADEAVYVFMCCLQVIGAFFVGKYLIDYRNALNDTRLQRLLT